MKKIFITLILCNLFSIVKAQNPEWYFIRPDNTGIGGDYLETVTSDCNGNIWTGGYMPFFSNGSVVRFNDDDTIYTCWGNYDGYLPADRITGIAFDNSDGVWVSTNGIGNGIAHGGIAHYNGNTWVQYTSANTPLPNDDMEGITIDGNNNVWATYSDVSSGFGGVAKFNGTTWTIYTSSNSNLQSGMVNKIVADSQNNIWIGSNLGLIKFDGLNWILYSPANSGMMGFDVKDVEYDASTNKIYAVTSTSVDIYDGTTWSHINSSNSPISSTGLYTAFARGDSIIIGVLASNSGCYVYNGVSWVTHSSSNHVYDSHIDVDGNFWICGIGFLEKYDGNTWKKYTRKNTGLVDYFNDDVFVDSKNRKWFANGEGGIQVFDCPHWEDYGKFNEGLFPSLQNNTPIGSSVTEDSYGDIWMTYYGGNGYAIQIPEGDYKDYASWKLWDNTNAGTNFQTPEEVEADDSGHVFMRLYNSTVQLYNHNTNAWTNLNSGNSILPAIGLQCMTPRIGGKMYFGSFMFIYILDNGTWSSIDFAALGLPIMYVFDIAFDHNNNMWLATDHGVYLYDGTTWTNWTEANSTIAADHVTSIAFGNADTVFIGAHNTQTFPYYGGISVYNGTSWTSFLEGSSPLAHKQVEDIEMDTLGNLWIITQTEGITVFKKGGVVGFDCIDRSLQPCMLTSVVENYFSADTAITVFPNPVTSFTTIEVNLSETKNISVTIIDVTGREVKNIATKNLSAGNNKIHLDLSELISGVYFLQLKSNQNLQTVKLIKN